jgi:hypothetical protein
MSGLPQFVRRLPYVFYGLAVVMGVWRVYNDWSATAFATQYAEDGSPAVLLAKSTALYWGLTDAIYVVGSGAMLHVLIAIYDKIAGGKE